MKKRRFRPGRLVLFVLIIVAGLSVFSIFGDFDAEPKIEKSEINYSQFIDDLESGRIEQVSFDNRKIDGKYKETFEGKEHHFSLKLPFEPDSEFIGKINSYGVDVKTNESGPGFFSVLVSFLPLIVVIAVVVLLGFILRNAQKGPMGGLKKGSRSLAQGIHRVHDEGMRSERFGDVAGIDEVVYELTEIVEFLKSPERFAKMGAEMPKGVLLFGPPGTGKTLIARAVAGEAGVPFLSVSGSEFVEMFVGVGASRVRDLFDKAKKVAPAIIFIDEIDAMGRQRGAGFGGGNDEREQTLNQILKEMDGFEPNSGLVIIGATNRPDILDPALLRPGRLDRRMVVPLPRQKGREKILEIHTRNKPLDGEVQLSELARLTFGFSGADLKNLCNEAAINAVRNRRGKIIIKDFKQARIRVMVGSERKEQPSEKEKETVAYHEAGHALVAFLLPEVPKLEQVSIVSRGITGGFTEASQEEENFILRKKYLLGQIKFAFGGRVAEEIIFGEPSTGAEDDLSKATQIAEDMVLRWAMSDRFPPRTFGRGDSPVFLGRDFQRLQNYSDQKQAQIDEEVERLMLEAYEEVVDLLQNKRNMLEKLAMELLEKEELSRKDIEELFS